MIKGPDISFYQDDNETPQKVNFDQMKSAGASFVICRAGQKNWPDQDFNDYWRGAKSAGLPRGSYWYYDSRESPITQAVLWIETMKNDLGELPLFVDLEERYGGTYAGASNWKKFIDKLKQLVPGKEIVIYTAYYYWLENCPTSYHPYFEQFPLWIANYGVPSPRIPLPWSEWLFWQYTTTADGKAFGVESLGIDMNYFNGDENKFKERFNLGENPPSGGTMSKFTAVSNTYDMSIRDGHSTYASRLGVVLRGGVMEGDEVWVSDADGDQVMTGDKWMHVTKAVLSDGSVVTDGWVAVIHLGKVYCELTEHQTGPVIDVVRYSYDHVTHTGYFEYTVDGVVVRKELS